MKQKVGVYLQMTQGHRQDHLLLKQQIPHLCMQGLPCRILLAMSTGVWLVRWAEMRRKTEISHQKMMMKVRTWIFFSRFVVWWEVAYWVFFSFLFLSCFYLLISFSFLSNICSSQDLNSRIRAFNRLHASQGVTIQPDWHYSAHLHVPIICKILQNV